MVGCSSLHRIKSLFALISAFALLNASCGPVAAQGANGQPLSRAKLEQLAAPIALHPDSLLTQILIAATYPLDVVQAARWRKANPDLKGSRLQEALQGKGWDESVKSLTVFRDVLRMMSDELEWTEQLGEAFLAQEDELLAAVQDLRRRAEAAGNLNSTPEQRVGRSGDYVIIEPVDADIMYVPIYDPVVYGMWPYPEYPPYHWYSARQQQGRILGSVPFQCSRTR